MSPRRSIPHRFALWISGAVLALTVYLASYPFAFDWTMHRSWTAFRVMQAVYSPLALLIRQPDWIGSRTYADYVNWVFFKLNEPIIDAEARNAFDSSTSVDSAGTSLRDVVQYLSEVHNFPIELDPEVNGDLEITVSSKAQLGEVLRTMLEPHGLTAWPAHQRIAIGSPAAIERIKAADQAADRAMHPLPRGAWILLALLTLSFVSLWLLLRRRRRVNQIPTEPAA
jgi:hypothetical protein